MKKSLGIIVCFLIAMFLASGCGQNNKSGTYFNKKEGFSVEFPEGWKKIKTEFGMVVNYTDPEERIKVGIQHQKLPSGKTLEETIKFLPGLFSQQGFKLIDESEAVIDGNDAYWFRLILNTNIFSYYIVLKGQDCFAIIFSYDKDSTSEDAEDTIEGIVNSFRFMDK